MNPIRQKLGQMFIVGCQGEALSKPQQLLVEEYQFGGFILFKENCREAAQLVALSHQLWQALDEIPPFIAIDQEGGRVHRLPPPFSHFPTAARIGAKNDTGLAYRLGQAAAAELALAGVNLNFAPVLDVHSNPTNPIIGDRAFASEPKQVITMSSAWTDGLRAGGIIPCGKHFPGHGDTDKDSHVDSPVVKKSLDQLQAAELPPFAHACRAKIEALMTAHVVYTALDAKLPATLSEAVVTGLLRHQLGYDGVVFSDDLEMQAIGANYGVEETAHRAVRAGVDVLLFCHDLDKAVAAFEFLADQAERDAALRNRIEASQRRVSEVKRRYVKSFTGVAASEIVTRLAQLNHQPLIDGCL